MVNELPRDWLQFARDEAEQLNIGRPIFIWARLNAPVVSCRHGLPDCLGGAGADGR